MAVLEGATQRVEALGTAGDELTRSINSAGGALNGINRAVLDGGNSMEALASGIMGAASAAAGITSTIDNLISIIPGLGGVGDAFGGLGTVFTSVGKLMSNFVASINEAAIVMDGLTGINREMTESLYGTASGFGQTLSEAMLYKDMVLSMADDFATREFGFIRLSESKEMFEAARQSKLSLEDLSSTVTTAGASMQAYAAGILQASAMGIELREYTGLLGDAIYGQGLDTEESMMQLSMFKDIAKDTGIAMDDVTGTLQNVSKGFRTMGIRADFGEPILRGFAASLKDIGLGAENAGKLTEGLTSSIANIASDPALAYITSKFGDLGYGNGGGALQASIGMQADLLRSERPGDQSKFSMEMVSGMIETIKKASGGQDIATVFDAEKDTSLASTNYTQKSMLEGTFGIAAGDSQRTLEMLAQFEDATRTGDTDLVNQLAKDLADGKNIRNATQGWQKEMSAVIDGAAANIALQTDATLGVAKHLGSMKISQRGKDLNSGMDGSFQDFKDRNNSLKGTHRDLATGVMSIDDVEKMFNDAKNMELLGSNIFGGPNNDQSNDTTQYGNGNSKIDITPMEPRFVEMIIKLGSIEIAIGNLADAIKKRGGLSGQVGVLN